MEKLLTTKDLALALGVSDSSMRRWTDTGAIRTARTVGGHRRIALSEAIRFIRESGATLLRPDLLGLPGLPHLPTLTPGSAVGAGALEPRLYDALVAGDVQTAKGCVTALYLGGMSAAAICDGPLRQTMQRVGELWLNEAQGILIEHRATVTCLHTLILLRQLLAEPSPSSPLALGGAPENDPYLLPSLMASIVLVEAGFREMNFGPNTPIELLLEAARQHQATLVWLSLKSSPDTIKFRRSIQNLAQQLQTTAAKLIVGGTALESLGHLTAPNLLIMHTMSELSAFARGFSSPAAPSPS